VDRLIVTTVTLGQEQISFIKRNCNNVSRYIRSLIDREMGAERASQVYYQPNKKQEPQPKTLNWSHLK